MTMRFYGAALLTCVAACDQPVGDIATIVELRDSLGVPIVESAEPMWTAATQWRIADAPRLIIGTADGGPSSQFAHVAGAHWLSDGTIAVVDFWNLSVSFFDTDGRPVGAFTRSGSGPGELRPGAIRGSFTCGGDVVHVAVGNAIISYRPPDQHVSTVTLERPATVKGCMRDAFVAVTRHGASGGEGGLLLDSVALTVFTINGAEVGTIDSVPSQLSNRVVGPEGRGVSPAPFTPVQQLAFSPLKMANGYGASYEVVVRDDLGKPTHILRRVAAARKVSDADVRDFLRFVGDPWRGEKADWRRIEENYRGAVGQPRPAFAELKIDADGNVWSRAYDHLDAIAFYDYSRFMRSAKIVRARQPRMWSVFDTTGTFLGEIGLPPEFQVHQIGRNAVLGVWRDELDVPTVRIYDLLKPTAAER